MSVLRVSMLLAALLAHLASLTRGAEIAYCSPENTGADTGFQAGNGQRTVPTFIHANAVHAVYNQFNSDGSCEVKCQSSYAFAILLGADCWCSNYAPSNLKQTNQCDDPCPGYQSDWCGSSSAGLYGYIALSIAPSGTIGGASPSQPTSSSPPSSSVSTHPSTHREHTSPISSSTSAVETTPAFGESITTLTSVVSAQSSVQASSSTAESSTVVVPASSATTSSTSVWNFSFLSPRLRVGNYGPG
jgi:cell wall integrity and stress response component